MDVVSQYHSFFNNNTGNEHDFRLFRYTDSIYLGEDKIGNAVIVCISTKPNRSPVLQRTQVLSIECNMKVKYVVEGKEESDTVHIIRCLSQSQKEKDIFIELSSLFIEACRQEDQVSALLDTVSILSSFFTNKKEPSDIELQGLFAELLTIKRFHNSLRLGDYWHTNDRMNFDFSITEKIKIEVKSTVNKERKHHFKHEQLAYETYDIYVVSYMLKSDDEGTSLYDLIISTKPLFANDPRRIMILNKYLKNTSESRLKQCRFNEQLAISNCRFYYAREIPRFSEQAPIGLTNAEYDCNLENANSINEEKFTEEIILR